MVERAEKVETETKIQLISILNFLNELTKLGALQWQKKPTSDSKNVLVSSCVYESEFEASEDFEASEGFTVYFLAVRKPKLDQLHAASQKNKSSLKVTSPNEKHNFYLCLSDWTTKGNYTYPRDNLEGAMDDLCDSIHKQQEGGCDYLRAAKCFNQSLAAKLSACEKENQNG